MNLNYINVGNKIYFIIIYIYIYIYIFNFKGFVCTTRRWRSHTIQSAKLESLQYHQRRVCSKLQQLFFKKVEVHSDTGSYQRCGKIGNELTNIMSRVGFWMSFCFRLM